MLSVVIIGHNEQGTIAETICSVIRATSQAARFLRSYEIILVDDDSTDETVSIASRFPITILQHERRLGPSAARHTGYEHASPEAHFILFLDGDTTLYESWLPNAIQYMDAHPGVAGVSGEIYTSIYTSQSHTVPPSISVSPCDPVHGSPEEFLRGGASMYRKRVLDQTGSYNPSTLGEEELELAFRINQNGYELHSLNVPVGVHNIKSSKTSIFHRARFYQGIGQLLRMYRGTPLPLRLIRKYYFNFSAIGWIALCISLAILSVIGLVHNSIWVALAIITIWVYLLVAARMGGLLKAAAIFIRTLPESFSILVGLMRAQDSTSLPPPKVLKKEPEHEFDQEDAVPGAQLAQTRSGG